MARLASLVIILILSACSAEDSKYFHAQSCAIDRRTVAEYEECFKDAGCKHEPYHYARRDDIKARIARDCNAD